MRDDWLYRLLGVVVRGNYEDTPALILGTGLFSHAVVIIFLYSFYVAGDRVALYLLLAEVALFIIVAAIFSAGHILHRLSGPAPAPTKPLRSLDLDLSLEGDGDVDSPGLVVSESSREALDAVG